MLIFRALTHSLTALLLWHSAAQASPEPLRIGYQKYGTLVLLKASGELEKKLAPQGVEVRWIEFPAGPQLLEGLNVGAVDFGTTGETPPIIAQAAGADLVYLAHEPAAPSSEAIVVPAASELRSVADLKGKRVALNKGSNVHYLLVRALQAHGLSITDIKPVYLPPADARAAFERGSVDAWVIWDPFLAAAQEQLRVRVLADGAGLVNNHQFYLGTRRLAEQQPEVVRVLLQELDRTGHWIAANPDQAVAQVAPLLGLPPDITRVAVTRLRYGISTLSPGTIQAQQAIADTFHQLRLIPRALDVASIVWTPRP